MRLHSAPRTGPPVPPRVDRPARRRRATGDDPLRKVTLRLHESVADAVRAVVDAGAAPSADVFIEEAVIAALRERRRQRLYAAYAEAAADSAFRADMDDVTDAFADATDDGLGTTR